MKRFLRLLVLAILGVGLAAAQNATVTRNVNLRPDASTDNDPIEKLTPPAQVQLVEADPTNGFYHVTTADGQDGWVWGRNIHILAVGPDTGPTTTTTPTPTPAPTLTPSPTPSGDLFS